MRVLALAALLCIPAMAAKNGETTLLCENDDGTTAPAKIVVKAGGGHKLFVCGTIEKKKGATELSGFKVFVVGKNGKKQKGHVFQSPREFTLFRLVKSPDSLIFDEVIWDGTKNIPAYETKITCDEKSCRISPATCALKPSKTISKKPLTEVKRYISGTKKGKLPGEKLISRLAGLAYSGDKDAQAIFKDRGALMLDGKAGEIYFDHQAMIERLKRSGCL